jgi:hypothetical protein
MSPCRNWDSPTPSPACESAPPPGTKGEAGRAHSPAGEGLGESQFRRLEKKLRSLPTQWRLRSTIRNRLGGGQLVDSMELLCGGQ